MMLVVELRNWAQVNSGDRENSTPIEGLQRGHDEIAGRREQNRRIEQPGRLLARLADPVRAEALGKLAMLAAAAHHQHAASPMAQHLDRDMGRAAEAVQSHGRAGLNPGALYRTVADDSC